LARSACAQTLALRQNAEQRRGAVAVMLAVVIPVMIAFAALSVDVGMMYNAKADLQRAADAAAMAAASRLTALEQGSPIALAQQAAKQTAAANPIISQSPTITNSDIVFGRANIDLTTLQVTFTPTTVVPNAVRVTVRKEQGSPNGPLALYFARIFGRHFTDVRASATAAVSPRDIALVSDISGSLVFDSTFRRWETTHINIFEVWDALPGGAGDPGSTWAPSEVHTDVAQSAGPAWGFFKKMGFGDDPADQDTYSVNGDPGLISLPYGQTWTDTALASYMADMQYSADEIDAILDPDNTSYYENRVAIALGLATWNSGMPGGRWEVLGQSKVGNGNGYFGGSEVQYVEGFLSRSASDAANIWDDYIDRYANKNSPFRYQYGVKTMLDYVLEHRRSQSQTPELANVPVQPMQAIKDATRFMVDLLNNAQSFDQISLELYSTKGTHSVDLTHNFSEVTSVLDGSNASGSTNMGAGMQRAIEELTSSRARPEARKVMVLITDGRANINEYGKYSESGGRAYAIAQAHQAKANNIQIVTISVGQGADQQIMEDIASITSGTHFHAEGTIDQYSSQLEQIFAAVGGRRTVELIE
jgi:Flp pilus assembly protein TadG/uncharacterized protein YegL